MARTVTHAATALALLAALPILAACTVRAPPSSASTSDSVPTFGWAPPRMRAPSTERPAWLPSLPADPPRTPAPEHGFRARGDNPTRDRPPPSPMVAEVGRAVSP